MLPSFLSVTSDNFNTSNMSDNSTRFLCCLVGEATVLQLEVRISQNVFELRNQIYSSLERSILRFSQSKSLESENINMRHPLTPLCKPYAAAQLSCPCCAGSLDCRTISSDDSGSMLSGTDLISDIFPGNSLKKDRVSIVVRLKPIGETLCFLLQPTSYGSLHRGI